MRSIGQLQISKVFSNFSCRWLVEQNRSILIRDKDWDKIIIDIEENEMSFSRYYPMVRVAINSTNLVYMTKAIILNDALFDYCSHTH